MFAGGSRVFEAYLQAGALTRTVSWANGTAHQEVYAVANGGHIANTGLLDKVGLADSWMVDHAFANSGTVDIEAGSLVLQLGGSNATTIDVGPQAMLTVSGDLTGSGVVTLHGAGATAELGGASSNTISFADNGGGVLQLGQASAFSGAIEGFGTNDALDLQGFSGASTVNWQPGQSGTGGTLQVTDGALKASLALAGHYTGFLSAPDHEQTELLIKVA